MRRHLRVVTLALTLIGSVLATAYAEEPIPNRTLTCTAASSGRFACFVEQTVASIGPWELALGVDALARPWGAEYQVGGYALLGYWGDAWGAWVELHVPRIAPIVGSPDVLRVGFRLRF